MQNTNTGTYYQLTGEVLSKAKLKWVLGIVGLILFIAGSMFAVDWMIYLYKIEGNYYAGVAKPTISLLCLVLVVLIGKNYLDRRDWVLLLLAFCFMLPTDILMSVVGLNPDVPVDSPIFMVGGVLSIFAHIVLIIRLGRGFPYFKSSWKERYPDQTLLGKIWLPLAVYGSAVIAIIILWDDMALVGHTVIGPIYTAFFCTTTWFAWETVRYKLYPRLNAWFAALAATCWYLTEITGEIYNIGIGDISEIIYRIIWIFYGTNVVLFALSGFRWKE